MNQPERDPTTLVSLLLLAWAAVMAWAFWSFHTTPPTGDGFTRGMNRITGFLGWQLVAGALGLVAFVTGRGLPKGTPLRLLSTLPLALIALGLLALIGVVLWARFSHP
ncbi:hypothetical protein ACMU_14165 [Actibacterium mucosum KCTC 23349]|uniref:Uncharacterized protein n=1 Tax=Actibacterium mucosum KCTC 23349 TaxID=1454373 RepID=A0A037ZEN1_9RHOB|nr:hypothetical protein [Actibacterium mucosum]KAJ54905.1 hypothetical protein ACMU_14165 [Actibacterium mucosum KCTC 23349]